MSPGAPDVFDAITAEGDEPSTSRPGVAYEPPVWSGGGATITIDQALGECVISGWPDQVAACAAAVRMVMMEGDGLTTERLKCDGSEGLLIGKGGATVKGIARETGTRVISE